MESKERGYRKVEYNARYNQDRLYRMRISHDTLLEYSKKMVVQYPGLQQIIIDKYPYIFIDEYQAELLSNDREKLGRAAAFLYRILKLYTDIREEETPVEEILYGDITKYTNLDI